MIDVMLTLKVIFSFTTGIVVMMISFWVYYKIKYLLKKRRLEKEHRERMERRRIEQEIYDIWATQGRNNNVRNYLDGFDYFIPKRESKEPIKPIKKPMYHHFTGLPWE
jgi:hypothetical protein